MGLVKLVLYWTPAAAKPREVIVRRRALKLQARLLNNAEIRAHAFRYRNDYGCVRLVKLVQHFPRPAQIVRVDAVTVLSRPSVGINRFVHWLVEFNDVRELAVELVDRRNRADERGERRVRIHAVAFPVLFEVTGDMLTAARFAILMRALCQRNGGTFVALPHRRAR